MDKSFRSSIDITPWCTEGHSAFGLKRGQAKWVGTAFIILAILMLSPPTIPSPDDLINITIANWMHGYVGIDKTLALAITYTIIPFVLFLLGIYIYPYNTKSLFNGYMNKLKKIANKLLKNPIYLIIMAIIGIYVFKWYLTFL